jgi:thymidylate synthase (FAD)
MEGFVTLLDKMGNDLSVVNAARVSFNKESLDLKEGDKKLIKYLATHKHWTPFAHCFLSFRIEAPIFVARQLSKHQIGLTWNEISRRYVDYEPSVWSVKYFRKKAENKKQGSSSTIIPDVHLIYAYDDAVRHAVDTYNFLIKDGVCPEQARAVLPLGTNTQWIWSGSLHAFSRVYALRHTEDVQKETKDVVECLGIECFKNFPTSWSALTNE